MSDVIDMELEPDGAWSVAASDLRLYHNLGDGCRRAGARRQEEEVESVLPRGLFVDFEA